MGKIDKVGIGKINFYERFSGYTDAQILEILKNQKNYQENAKNAAVTIAIERQLIQSESDLLLPEFQGNKTTGFTLFPQIAEEYHLRNIIGSTFRFLYILSFLPIVYGFLMYAQGFIDQTILAGCIGCVWILLVTFLKKTGKTVVLLALLGILTFVGSTIGFKIAANHPIRFFDFFILIVGLLFSVYFLIYGQLLVQNKSQSTK
jgi:hypothetical protein